MALFRFHWRVAYDPGTAAPVADGVPVVIYAAASGGSPLQAFSSVGTPISPTTQGGLTPEFYLEDRTDCFVDAGSDRFYVTADSFPTEARDAALAAAATVAGYEARLAAVEAGGATSLTAGSVTTVKLADGAVTDPKVTTVSMDKIVDSAARVAMLPAERVKLTSLTTTPAAPVYTTGVYAARPNTDLSWPTPTVSDVARAAIDAAGQSVWWMKPTGAVTPTYANGLRQGDIIFPAAPIPGPVASFTATRVGLTREYNFSAAASTATSPATITGYAWDFGDTYTATGVSANHTYLSDGVRTVTLTVTDSNSLTGEATTVVTPSAVNMLFSDSFTGADNTLVTARDCDQYSGGTTTTRPTDTGTAGYAKIVSNRLRIQAAGGTKFPTTMTYCDFRVVVKSWTAGLTIYPVEWDANNFAGVQVTATNEFKRQVKTTAAGYNLSASLATVQADDEVRIVWDATLPNAGSTAFGGYRFQLWRGGSLFFEATSSASFNGTFPVTTPQTGARVFPILTTGTTASEVDDLRFIQVAAS